MTTTVFRLLAIAALAATLVIAPGCRKAQDAAIEQALENATGAKVDKDGDALTFKTDKGEVKIAAAEDGGSVALPDGFPDDVYLPDNHKVASAMDMGGMQIVNLTTPAAMGTVYADADKAMQGKGWKREMAMQSGDGSTLMYTKGDQQVVYQLLKGDDGGTQLAIRTGNAAGG
ncbi:MAG: hypothetical protein QM612_02870 [Thermomonas sp.]|uniref:hypothetical protein n=1 Tax=Thermomonas sp. TaxID=1971895 RepID=UPI0039E3811D